jgi:hypothetical protein
MTSGDPSAGKSIEGRFRDFSVDVREERLVRYILHQVESGRHVDDIVSDAYVTEHFDEVARSAILESPEVIEAIERQIRRQFAGYGDSFPRPLDDEGERDSTGVTNADLSHL